MTDTDIKVLRGTSTRKGRRRKSRNRAKQEQERDRQTQQGPGPRCRPGGEGEEGLRDWEQWRVRNGEHSRDLNRENREPKKLERKQAQEMSEKLSDGSFKDSRG